MADATALQFSINFDASSIAQGMGQVRQTVAGGMRDMAQVAQTESHRLSDAFSNITGFADLKEGVKHVAEILGISNNKIDDYGKVITVATDSINGLSVAQNTLKIAPIDTKTFIDTSKAAATMRSDVVAMSDQSSASLLKAGGTIWAVASLGMAIVAATKEAKAYAAIEWPTGTAPAEAVDKLKSSLRGLTLDVPMALDGLIKIGGVALRLGNTTADIREFTSASAKMASVFGVSAQQSSDYAEKLIVGFRISATGVATIYDKINTMAQSGNNSKSQMLEIVANTAKAAEQFGLGTSSAVAFASSIISIGGSADKVTANIKNFLEGLSNLKTGSREVEQALSIMGTSGSQLAKEIREGPAEAIVHFLTTLKGLDDTTSKLVIGQLFSTDEAANVQAMVANVDQLGKKFAASSEHALSAGSVQRQYAASVRDARAEMDRFVQAMDTSSAALGEYFLPSVNSGITAIGSLFSGITGLVAEFPILSTVALMAGGTILKLGMAFVTWKFIQPAIEAIVISLGSMIGLGAPLTTFFFTLNAVENAIIALGAYVGKAAFGLLFSPFMLGVVAAGVAIWGLTKLLPESAAELRAYAAELGKARLGFEAQKNQIAEWEKLQDTLLNTTNGTVAHRDAEEQLARVMDNATVSIDANGRSLAMVSDVTSVNIAKLKEMIALKSEDMEKSQLANFALALEAEAKALELNKEKQKEIINVSRERLHTDKEALSLGEQLDVFMNRKLGMYNLIQGKLLDSNRAVLESAKGLEAEAAAAVAAGVKWEDLADIFARFKMDDTTIASIKQVFAAANGGGVDPGAALAASREALTEKIEALKELKDILTTTRSGTDSYTDAEVKLAAILPGATTAMDEHGRSVARVADETSENFTKLAEYIDLLGKEDTQKLTQQVVQQTVAFDKANQKIDQHTNLISSKYGPATGGASTITQKFTIYLDQLTGSYSKNIQKNEDLQSKMNASKTALEELAVEAGKSGITMAEFGAQMNGIRIDPALRDRIIDLFRSTALEAEKAKAAIVPSITSQMAALAASMKEPMEAAQKSIADAMKVIDGQLKKYDEDLNKHRAVLKQAVDDEAKSWKAMADAQAEVNKTNLGKIDQEFKLRHQQIDALAGAAVLSEQRKTQAITALTIQETNAKLAEDRRYSAAAMAIVNSEFTSKVASAERLGLNAARMDEERLQAQKKVLETIEASYRQTIDRLIAEENRHLDAIRKIEDEKATYKLSIQDRLANLAEKLMTAVQVYADKEKRIAAEKAAAEEELRKGNFESAKKHAERMASLAEQSANAVKDGDKVIVSEQQAVTTATKQVREAAELTSQAFQGMEKSHKDAYGALRANVDAIKEAEKNAQTAIDGLNAGMAKDHKKTLEVDTEQIKKASGEIDDLASKLKNLSDVKVDIQVSATDLEKIPDQLKKLDVLSVKTTMDNLSNNFWKFKKEFDGFNPEIKATFDEVKARQAVDNVTTIFNDFKLKTAEGISIPIKADITDADSKMDALAAKAQLLDERPKNLKFDAETEAASSAIINLLRDVNQLAGKTFSYTMEQVNRVVPSRGASGDYDTDDPNYVDDSGDAGENSQGGPIGFDRGGHLPGYGGGDRIRAMLEDGEFVIRKEAVKRYGKQLFFLLNGMQWQMPSISRFAFGGLVSNLTMPPMPAFATGGAVGQRIESGGVIRLDLTMNNHQVGSFSGAKQDVASLVEVLKGLKKMV